MASSASSVADAAGPASATLPKVETRAIVGVGDVPVWSADHGALPPCAPGVLAQARLVELAKGEDAAIGDGSADLAALLSNVTADCPAAARDLAQALADGGDKAIAGKKYPQGERYLRAALVVRPSLAAPRYALARRLAIEGKLDDATWAIAELARAVKEGDPRATVLLERARMEDDLASVRDAPGFAAALAIAPPADVLAATKLEPALTAQAIKQLPIDYALGASVTGKARQMKPVVAELYTWRPDDKTELLVATIADDASAIGHATGDELAGDYGAIAVYRRDGASLQLLRAEKAGAVPPVIAPGKNGTIAYAFTEACGELRGALVWKGGTVNVIEQTCRDI